MLAAKFVESEIRSWLTDNPPNTLDPREFYPVLARKIVEALKLYESKVLDYNGPKSLDITFIAAKDV